MPKLRIAFLPIGICLLIFTVGAASEPQATSSAVTDQPTPSTLGVPGCPNDADCDGIPNNIEAAVGGGGIDLAAGTVATSAIQSVDGWIIVSLANSLDPGPASVSLPPGTTAGPTPILLEFRTDSPTQGLSVIVQHAQLPPGATKSIAIRAGQELVAVIADFPGASRDDLLVAPPSARFWVPRCDCPRSTSTNLEGQVTPYTITNDGQSVHIHGLLHSAAGLTHLQAAVPAASTWVLTVFAMLMLVAGILIMRMRYARTPSA